MKVSVYSLIILLAILFANCNDVEDRREDVVKDDDEKEIVNKEAPKPVEKINCDFNLTMLKVGEEKNIDCIIDLKGNTINLANNVILSYANGGDIINGSINFSGDKSKIDGRLLNSTLSINGEVSLLDDVFVFNPSRWGNIVEGKVNYEVALENTKEFEQLMFRISDIGGKTFEVDQFDAFFEIATVTSTTSDQNFRTTKEAINLPSNFHLKMSSNTYIRMFNSITDATNGSLMAVRDVDNVKISGGNLIGDALERKYKSDSPGEEGALLFSIHASRNIEVDNVHFEYGSAGGITIFSLGFPFNTDYNPTDGVVIKNSTFENLRRMSTSVTDGKNIKIIGNRYVNTGQPVVEGDNGGNVGYAINLETFRRRDENGELLEFQRLNGVEIRDNVEENSRIGFLLVLGSSDVIAENNTAETRMSFNFSNGVRVLNNKFIGRKLAKEKFAIFGAGESSEFTFNNEISGNRITGNYGTGISLLTQKCKVFENIIKNSEVGIQLITSKEVEISDNTLDVNNIGILSNLTFIDKVSIIENTIESKGFYLKLTSVNQEVAHNNFQIDLERNQFVNDASITISNVNGLNLNNNEIEGGINLSTTSSVNITSNIIKPNESNGISISGSYSNTSILDNKIFEPTGADRFECINNTLEVSAGITILNNVCN